MKTLHAPRPFRKRAMTIKKNLRVELAPALQEMVVAAAIRSILSRELSDQEKHAVSRLRGMSIDQFNVFATHAARCVSVEVDLDALFAALNRDVQTSTPEQQIAYFIANGTSAAMLQHVFNLTRRRSYELLSETPPPTAPVQRAFGKTRLPGPAERDRIHLTWSKLKGALPDCYIALHQQFPDWSLATLDQVLNEFSR